MGRLKATSKGSNFQKKDKAFPAWVKKKTWSRSEECVERHIFSVSGVRPKSKWGPGDPVCRKTPEKPRPRGTSTLTVPWSFQHSNETVSSRIVLLISSAMA